MELTILDLNAQLSQKNLRQIKHRTRRTFDKIRDKVHSIKVTLDDVNGPKGGVDKHCKVVINLKGMPDIVVSDNQSTMMVSVNNALTRARTALLRKVKRKQKNLPAASFKPAPEMAV